jgi:hypothetical protein
MRVYNIAAKTRFKYKSMIKQGEMIIVSQIYQNESNSKSDHQSNGNNLGSNNNGYRLLTYTSKNEFYVINVQKGHKSSIDDDEQ